MQEVNNIETGQQPAPFVQENNKVETTQANLVTEKPKQNSFLITLLSILLLLSCTIAGFFAYQTQNLVKELTTLKNTTEPTPTSTSLPTEAPTATESGVVAGTENWKTYNGKFVSFKYPPDWVKNSDLELKGLNPNIRVVVAEEGSMMNECMQQGQSETRNGFVVKNFTRVSAGEMCSGKDLTELESWVVKDINSYGPGIQIFYNSNEPANKLPNAIISNILSTFKFTN